MKPNAYLHPDAHGKKFAEPEKPKKPTGDGPKVTAEHVQTILENTFIQASALPQNNPNTTMVFYQLPNGWTGVEYSSCVSPENFDMEIGLKICLKKIEEQIWNLEGYLLKQRLHEENEKKASGK